jgi:hypothetical protein
VIEIRVDGLERLTRAAETLGIMLSPAALEVETMKLAIEAGVILQRTAVRALIEGVYDLEATPQVRLAEGGWIHGGNPDERTDDLLHSLILRSEGFTQIVEVDPTMPVSENAHADRELVIDYAIPVHDGYVQHVPNGHGGSVNTGVFHPGRFWFKVAEAEAPPIILAFIETAFYEIVKRAVAAA